VATRQHLVGFFPISVLVAGPFPGIC